MRRLDAIQEVEKKRQTGLGAVLLWVSVFAMVLALLAGNVRLYEKKEQTRQLEQQLEQQQAELQELRRAAMKRSDLRKQAQALGMTEVDPVKIKVLHVRGNMTD